APATLSQSDGILKNVPVLPALPTARQLFAFINGASRIARRSSNGISLEEIIRLRGGGMTMNDFQLHSHHISQLKEAAANAATADQPYTIAMKKIPKPVIPIVSKKDISQSIVQGPPATQPHPK